MHFSCREETCAEHCSKNWKYGSTADFDQIEKKAKEMQQAENSILGIQTEKEMFKLWKGLGMAFNKLKDSEIYIVAAY